MKHQCSTPIKPYSNSRHWLPISDQKGHYQKNKWKTPKPLVLSEIVRIVIIVILVIKFIRCCCIIALINPFQWWWDACRQWHRRAMYVLFSARWGNLLRESWRQKNTHTHPICLTEVCLEGKNTSTSWHCRVVFWR